MKWLGQYLDIPLKEKPNLAHSSRKRFSADPGREPLLEQAAAFRFFSHPDV